MLVCYHTALAGFVDLTACNQGSKQKGNQASKHKGKRKNTLASSGASGHIDEKPKKVRAPSWTNRETLALIQPKSMQNAKT